MNTVNYILHHPELIANEFKNLNAYKFKFYNERNAIRLNYTLRLIEEILNETVSFASVPRK